MSDLPSARDDAPVVLELRGITKRFGPLVANDGIDLDLRRGEIVALLGENGAGKTTLMNILFGHYVADAGEVRVADRDGRLAPLAPGRPRAALAAGVGMVHQHFTLADGLSVLDNVVLGTESALRLTRATGPARAKLHALMDRSGLDVPLGALVGDLTVGERQRVEILKALYRDVRILVLDEPTAVLTPQEADGLFITLKTLTDRGLSVIFISHKLDEVIAIADRVAVLRGGRKVAERPTAGADRGQLAELMVGRAVPRSRREPRAPGEEVLALDHVSIAAPDVRSRLVDVSLVVRAGEIVGVAGVSGNGQKALADLLAGLVAPTSGTMRVLGSTMGSPTPGTVVAFGVGRIPEDRHGEGTIGPMTIAENIALESFRSKRFQRGGFLRFGEIHAHAERAIGAYDIRCPGPGAAIRQLSGGNMQKAVLARALDGEPKLILANQPTRGLDVGAVAEVHRRLLEARMRGAAIVLVTEDLDELIELSDRIAVMFRARLSASLPTEEVTMRSLGLMMAGHDPSEAA